MTGTKSPAVSVLMTAYNREAFIADAIKSVLASDYGDLELIVVDDLSSDGTLEIARHYENLDQRVRVFRNEANLGDYPNRNRAASFARGSYLKYVDSDDMIYPWGLGVQLRCMEGFPEAGFGLSSRSETDRPHPVLYSPAKAYHEEFFGRELFGRSPGSSIIRRQAFEAVGGFSGLRQLGDFEFWFKIGARYPLVTLPQALSWDRVHPGQEQNVNSETEKMAMRVQIVRRALASPDCPLDRAMRDAAMSAYRKKLVRTFWRLLLRSGRPWQALQYWHFVVRQMSRPLEPDEE